jgi:hypothetical protein
MLPLRAAGSAFWATLKETLPSPCPLLEPPSCIQSLAAAAVHWQSRFVETSRVPLPPAGENEVADASTVIAHLALEGAVTLWVEELHAPVHAAVRHAEIATRKQRILGAFERLSLKTACYLYKIRSERRSVPMRLTLGNGTMGPI